MNGNNNVARVSPQDSRATVRSLVAPESASGWGVMYEQATALVRSGFLPNSIKTPEQAIAIMLTGEELGVPKMTALRSIHIINGVPTCSADLMASLVLRAIDRQGDGELTVMPPTPEECTVYFRRWGKKERLAYTYSMEDAKKAGLLSKGGNWNTNARSMLRARATAHACRMGFPDVVNGVYAPEEIDVVEGGEDYGLGAEKWAKTPDEVIVVPLASETAPQAPKQTPAPIAEVVDEDTDEIETVESVKRDIQRIAKHYELDNSDLKTIATDLKLPAWVKLSLDDAIALRAELQARIDDALTPDDPVQATIIDAEYADADGEAGNDRWTDS